MKASNMELRQLSVGKFFLLFVFRILIYSYQSTARMPWREDNEISANVPAFSATDYDLWMYLFEKDNAHASKYLKEEHCVPDFRNESRDTLHLLYALAVQVSATTTSRKRSFLLSKRTMATPLIRQQGLHMYALFPHHLSHPESAFQRSAWISDAAFSIL